MAAELCGAYTYVYVTPAAAKVLGIADIRSVEPGCWMCLDVGLPQTHGIALQHSFAAMHAAVMAWEDIVCHSAG